MNRLTHGLRGEPGLVPPHLSDTVAKHTADPVASYHPEGGHQHWLLAQAAAARLDHCQLMIRAAHNDMMDRADLCWDIDQQTAVELLDTRLPKNPALVSRQPRQTAHGCRWLLARPHALSHPLIENGGWDETQRRVLLTGIHLIRTGEVEANLARLNGEAGLGHVEDLIARKPAEPETSVPDDADLGFHRREYERLRAELEAAHRASTLPRRRRPARP